MVISPLLSFGLKSQCRKLSVHDNSIFLDYTSDYRLQHSLSTVTTVVAYRETQFLNIKGITVWALELCGETTVNGPSSPVLKQLHWHIVRAQANCARFTYAIWWCGINIR